MRSQNKLRRRVGELIKSQALPVEMIEPGKELKVAELGHIWVENGGRDAVLVAKPIGRKAETFPFAQNDDSDIARATTRAIGALTTPLADGAKPL